MAQFLMNITYSAAAIFLVAISFSVVFSTTRFFHFAHAAVIVVAPYVCYELSTKCGIPLGISMAIGLFASAWLGWCLEKIVYRPMRNSGSSALILLLTSLGLYIILQNTVALIFGDDTKMISGSEAVSTISLYGARLTGVQVATIISAITLFFAKIYFIDRSKLGLSLRAIAADPELAKISGIEFDRAMGVTFFMGSFMAGLAGLFRALDVGMTPTMGLSMLLLGVVAVVLGGVGRTLGVAMASVLLAFLLQIASWQFGSNWEEATAFLVLLVILLWRPQGIFGKRLKKATV